MCENLLTILVVLELLMLRVCHLHRLPAYDTSRFMRGSEVNISSKKVTASTDEQTLNWTWFTEERNNTKSYHDREEDLSEIVIRNNMSTKNSSPENSLIENYNSTNSLKNTSCDEKSRITSDNQSGSISVQPWKNGKHLKPLRSLLSFTANNSARIKKIVSNELDQKSPVITNKSEGVFFSRSSQKNNYNLTNIKTILPARLALEHGSFEDVIKENTQALMKTLLKKQINSRNFSKPYFKIIRPRKVKSYNLERNADFRRLLIHPKFKLRLYNYYK